MVDFIQKNYLFLKALHIIVVVAWFAGLFYIFRLFVYHVKNKSNADLCNVFCVMESKLLRIIMIPASVITLLSGAALLLGLEGALGRPWFHAKALGVVLLFAYQALAFRTYKRFSKNDYYLTEAQCRWMNEIPTILLITIVMLVVLKPWT